MQSYIKQRGCVIAVWIVVPLMIVIGCAPTSLTNAQGTPLPPMATLDAVEVKRGKQVYQANCASCHGANAEGAPNWQKVDAQGNFPPPAHNDIGHTWHHPDRVLYELIRDGMADPLRPESELRMPAFGDKLSDADMHAVIDYFKSLWSVPHRVFQSGLTRDDLTQTPQAPTPGR